MAFQWQIDIRFLGQECASYRAEESVVLTYVRTYVYLGEDLALLQRLLQRLEAEPAASQAQQNRSKVSRLFGESWAIATLQRWPTSRQGLSFPWKTLSDSLPPLI
jgi:hypothetical protein